MNARNGRTIESEWQDEEYLLLCERILELAEADDRSFVDCMREAMQWWLETNLGAG